MERQLEELKAKMERSSAALAQFERELNVINPEEKTSILSARLLQLNTEYTKAQADRVAQGGGLQLASRTARWRPRRSRPRAKRCKKLTERLNEAQQKFAEVQDPLRRQPSGVHARPPAPSTKLERQLQSTRENIAAARRDRVQRGASTARRCCRRRCVETKAEFDRLNARSFEYQTLKREAEGDKKLYEELVRKIKEAGINASFQNSSIRVADPARPAVKPVFPQPRR